MKDRGNCCGILKISELWDNCYKNRYDWKEISNIMCILGRKSIGKYQTPVGIRNHLKPETTPGCWYEPDVSGNFSTFFHNFEGYLGGKWTGQYCGSQGVSLIYWSFFKLLFNVISLLGGCPLWPCLVDMRTSILWSDSKI